MSSVGPRQGDVAWYGDDHACPLEWAQGRFSIGPHLCVPSASGLGGSVQAEHAPVPAERIDVLRALHELAVATGGMLDLAELAQLTVARACALLGGSSATLSRWDQATGLLSILATESATPGSTATAVPPGEGLIGTVFAQAQPLIIRDYFF